MSIDVLSWVLKNSEETLGRRLVLIVLADCAHEDGTGAWPSVQTIAEKARMSKRQVQRCLKDLEASRAIERDGNSRAGTTCWTVLMGDNSSPRQNDTGDIQATTEGENVTQTVIEEEPSKTPPTPSTSDLLWRRFVEMRQRSPKKLRRTEMDAGTKRMIQSALEVGTPEEWLYAIDAILSSAHHVGRNDRGKVYLEPRHIFTACTHGTVRQHLDWLLDLPQTAGRGGLSSSADDVKIREAKRNVLLAFQLAGSGEIRRKGDESEAWLAEQGIAVTRDAFGRPRFE